MWVAIVVLAVAFTAALIIEEQSGLLRAGDRAPRFSALLHDGTPVSLEDLLARGNLVLVFYPKDFTAGCTREVCVLRDRYARLRELNAGVVGISGDDSASHTRFTTRYAIPFPLIADVDASLRRAFGVLRLGGLLPLAKRVTYVIDRGGVIRGVFHHEVRMSGHADDVIAVLETLQDR